MNRLVNLQAYIDDSSDESGVYVLAGYVASIDNWRDFSHEWAGMLSLGSLDPRGNFHFKMSEMALSPERMSRVPGFHNVINKHAKMSVACVINKHDIKSAISRLGTSIPHMMPNLNDLSAFAVCFSFLMNGYCNHLYENHSSLGIDGPTDFNFDETTEKQSIVDTWWTYKANVPEERRIFLGNAPTFESDQVALPIQAADFRAWWVRKWAVEFGLDHAIKGRYTFNSAAKAIPNLIISADEDKIVDLFRDVIWNEFGPDIPLFDKGPSFSPDGPSPLLRSFRHVKEYLGRILRKK